MKLSFQRAQIQACEGWLASAVVHLVLLIAVSLLFAPMLGDMFATVELEAQFVDSGDVPVLFEMSAAPTLEPEAGELTAAVGETPTLEIEHPNVVASRGSSGRGNRHLTAGRGGPSRKIGASNQASFFGTQATGDRFVYVLDVSPSMTPQRLARAVTELLRSIDQLRANQEFYVVLFGWQTRRMFDETGAPTMIRATLDNKLRLRQWLGGNITISGTDPREALRISLGMSADCVYFLSDGEFNQPTKSTYFLGSGPTVTQIVEGQNASDIPIHTIAFEDLRSEPAMSAIAESTGGQHRFVSAEDRVPGDSRKTRTRNRDLYGDALLRFRFSDEEDSTDDDKSSASSRSDHN